MKNFLLSLIILALCGCIVSDNRLVVVNKLNHNFLIYFSCKENLSLTEPIGSTIWYEVYSFEAKKAYQGTTDISFFRKNNVDSRGIFIDSMDGVSFSTYRFSETIPRELRQYRGNAKYSVGRIKKSYNVKTINEIEIKNISYPFSWDSRFNECNNGRLYFYFIDMGTFDEFGLEYVVNENKFIRKDFLIEELEEMDWKIIIE